MYFSERSVIKEGRVEDSTSSLKLKRSYWVRKRESGIFSLWRRSQKPMSDMRSIFSPFIS